MNQSPGKRRGSQNKSKKNTKEAPETSTFAPVDKDGTQVHTNVEEGGDEGEEYAEDLFTAMDDDEEEENAKHTEAMAKLEEENISLRKANEELTANNVIRMHDYDGLIVTRDSLEKEKKAAIEEKDKANKEKQTLEKQNKELSEKITKLTQEKPKDTAVNGTISADKEKDYQSQIAKLETKIKDLKEVVSGSAQRFGQTDELSNFKSLCEEQKKALSQMATSFNATELKLSNEVKRLQRLVDKSQEESKTTKAAERRLIQDLKHTENFARAASIELEVEKKSKKELLNEKIALIQKLNAFETDLNSSSAKELADIQRRWEEKRDQNLVSTPENKNSFSSKVSEERDRVDKIKNKARMLELENENERLKTELKRSNHIIPEASEAEEGNLLLSTRSQPASTENKKDNRKNALYFISGAACTLAGGALFLLSSTKR